MGVYTSTMRFTGTSGVDVESMVESLMEAESTKVDRIYREKVKLEWQQEAIRSLGNNTRTFSDNYLAFSSSSTIANMRSAATFGTKSITGTFSGGETTTGSSSSSTGSSKIDLGGSSSISVNTETENGDYDVTVNSAACGQTNKGTSFSSTVTGDTYDVADIESGDYLDMTVNGTKKRITFTDDDVTELQKGGVEAVKRLQSKIDDTFGTIGGESKVEVGNSGGHITLSANDSAGCSFSVTMDGGVNEPNSIVGTNPMDDLDTDGDGEIDSDTDITFNVDGTDVTFSVKKGDSKSDYVDNLNTALRENGDYATASINSDGNLVLKSKTNEDKDISGLPGIDGTLTGGRSIASDIGLSETNNSSTFNINSNMGYTGTSTITLDDGTEIEVNEDTTYKSFMNDVNANSSFNLSFSTNSNSFTLETKEIGSSAGIDIKSGSVFKTKFGIDTTASMEAKDASVTVTTPDGVTQTIIRETNEFEYSGMSFDLDPDLNKQIYDGDDDDGDGAIEDNPIHTTITVETNTDEVYDTIEGFLNDYNAMIDELNGAINETPAKSSQYDSYEPLTDDEKAEMTDDQIEEYEEKAKQGIIRNDSGLTRMTSQLREATQKEVTLDDGSKISLASIGITTGDYSTGGKLYITDEDKLRDALEDRPDDVAALFTDSENGIAESMYQVIDDAVGRNGYITQNAGFEDGIYATNNYYTKEIEEKAQELEDMYDYLEDKEDHYYEIFANMEQVINEANSEMAIISSYS